jgi:phosphatidylethanolamine/phosphatidyl-N-methylethanolamine N-methyltransferase
MKFKGNAKKKFNTIKKDIAVGTQFVMTAIRDPFVGALTRASSDTRKAIIAAIPSGAKVIVEYGPGDGIVTDEIISRFPEARIIIIERNQDFIEQLSARYKGTNVEVVHGIAQEVGAHLKERGILAADVVISGIPFSFFSPNVRFGIVNATHDMLADGGVFIVYQYSELMMAMLRKVFSSVESKLVFRNIPPYFIMQAKKSGK